jgi:preprotein translocase subunit SecD
MKKMTKNLGAAALIFAGAALAAWIIVSPRWPLKLGLDLQGGSHLIYRADISGLATDEIDDALAGVRDVIERRVNLFGVSEPVVQTNRTGAEQRIIVDLAGVHDAKEAIALIGATPQLDFRREIAGDEASAQLNIDDPSTLTGPIFERTDLTGQQLQRATLGFDRISGTPNINLEFDSEGADLFAKLTSENIGKRLAIYLDGIPISAPVIQSEITQGRAVISGGFTVEEARELVQRLNAGALPVPIELIGQQTIGPTLGQRSVEQSVLAGLLGLVAVVVWLTVFYRLPGAVASISLIIYAIVLVALVKVLGVTLTLAGIAGVILSMGTAVDANVLIFERLKENIRLGKNVPYALRNGFDDASTAIWAANISSLLTALILYMLGTSIIRGFAVTLSIGTVLSMFTAVVVTRVLLEVALAWPTTHRPFLLSAKPDQPAAAL